MEIQSVDLKNFSSLRVGGVGKVCIVTKLKELIEVVMYANTHGIKFGVIGEGTNTFFGQAPDGIFVKMMIRGISVEERDENVFVTASAGEQWDDIVQFAVARNLWGIENLSYIPGTVGAAPVQNIGAYGAELADTFVSLSALDRKTLDIVEITRDACEFGYRDSLFKQEKDRYIIISITLKLSLTPKPVLTYKPLDSLLGRENITLQAIRDLVIETRKAKLPNYHEYPNTGSFFKNPVVTGAQGEALRATHQDIPLIPHLDGYKIPAAWLIEHIASMKGVRIRDVGTWPNQPLVLVNYGNATAEDIINFSDQIIQKIEEKTGITLEKEVNFVP